MSTLFRIVVLALILSVSAKADDIRDFEIEGMSIGDSLLDYFSKDEIKSNINYDSYEWISEKKFFDFELYDSERFDQYEGVQITIKINDKKYIIHSIAAGIFYKHNIDDCYSDMKIIIKDLQEMFTNAKTDLNKKLNHPTGRGTALSNWFDVDGGSISVMCSDWNKEAENEYGWTDNIRVEVRTNEFGEWLSSN